MQDFVLDLLPRTARWPRRLRRTLTERVEGSILDLSALLARAEAQRGAMRSRLLRDADGLLAAHRDLLRLAGSLHLLSAGSRAHLDVLLGEIGRLLGGWLRREVELSST